ncbi:MAG: glycosyltransferase [Cytophagales bacterium]|nr:glycosyltransferase [Bernardetiaceae bacterium]MDW8205477.1 glycosyltransferase [Cytophagales bacterium]
MELNDIWIATLWLAAALTWLHLLLQGAWFSKLVFFKNSAQQNVVPEGVSVIVVARNEHDNLVHLLPILLEQNYPTRYEVIVADDNSTDDTFWLLKTASQAYEHLKVVTVKYTPPGIHPKKYALTLAIKAAQYEHIVLTDADCRPCSSNWLTALTAHFNGKQIVLGYSPYKEQKSWLNRLIRYETLYTGMQYLSAALWGHPYMGVGRNLAYTKTLFLTNKGFNKFQRVIGGDDDLFINMVANANNTAVAIGAPTLVYSIPKTTWRAWWQQKRRHLSVGRYYRLSHRLWLGINVLTGFLSNGILWGALVTALLLQQWLPAVILAALIAIRWGFLGTITYICAKQLGDRFNIATWLLLDLAYTIYYLMAGLSVTVSKKVEWK